ncbi:hypothetical protein [Halorubrum ezzemoulense]|uniref:Uncharacterized protein n=1 Tax=Halorubrum ezzemoulense TaxID=337243 RepID=A0A481RIS2_HALEZ|nr:hypothetical protein [Halorubrum ezzemoulense]QAY21072.1 hypothetical protein EO776_14155 [Halorubrum ezzemoulense]
MAFSALSGIFNVPQVNGIHAGQLLFGVGPILSLIGIFFYANNKILKMISIPVFAIILAGMNRFPAYFLFGWDEPSSLYFTRSVAEGEFISQGGSWHFFALFSEILGLNIRYSFDLIAISLVGILSVFLFLWCTELTETKPSLICIFILSNWWFIEFHSYVVKETLGLPLAIFVAWILLIYFRTSDVRMIYILPVITLTTVVTHHLSTLLLLITAISLIITIHSRDLLTKVGVSVKNTLQVRITPIISIFIIVLGYWSLIYTTPLSLGITPIIRPVLGISTNFVQAGGATLSPDSLYTTFRLEWRSWKVYCIGFLIIAFYLFRLKKEKLLFGSDIEIFLLLAACAHVAIVVTIWTTNSVLGGWRIVNFSWVFIIPLFFIILSKSVSRDYMYKIAYVLILLNLLAFPYHHVNIEADPQFEAGEPAFGYTEQDPAALAWTEKYSTTPITPTQPYRAMLKHSSVETVSKADSSWIIDSKCKDSLIFTGPASETYLKVGFSGKSTKNIGMGDYLYSNDRNRLVSCNSMLI